MRNFSYKKQPAVIRTLKEPPKPKKKFNLDRLLFLGLLGLLALWFARYLFVSLAYVTVDGQISLEKLNVNFTNDIRLKTLHTQEGSSIGSGDTLFSYIHQSFDDNTSILTRQKNDQDDLAELLRKQQFESQKLSIEKEAISKSIEQVKLTMQRNHQLATLDVLTKNDIKSGQQQLTTLQLRAWELEREIELMRHQINLTQEKFNALESINTQGLAESNGSTTSYYIAPTSGLVGQINFSPDEVCYETQSVMTIHNTKAVCIKAYFNQEALKEIGVGNEVRIDFPDGSSTGGYIDNLSVATYELPSEFQKKYEPTQRSLLVTVVPKQQEDLDLWKRYYKMTVKVTISKWF